MRLAPVLAVLTLMLLAPTVTARPVDVETGDDAQGELVAVSATGRASSSRTCTSDGAACIGGMAASGTGDANGSTAVSGTGDAVAQEGCVPSPPYPTRCAEGGLAASGLGDADATYGYKCAYSADLPLVLCDNGAAASGAGDATGAIALAPLGHAYGMTDALVECDPTSPYCFVILGAAPATAVGGKGATCQYTANCVGIAPTGDASCDGIGTCVLVAPTGEASCRTAFGDCDTLSVTGNASCTNFAGGCTSIAVLGNAWCYDTNWADCTSASLLGDASGNEVVVAPVGTASSDCRDWWKDCVTLTQNGDARACQEDPRCIALAPHGSAYGTYAVAGGGSAYCYHIGCAAVAAQGPAQGWIAAGGSTARGSFAAASPGDAWCSYWATLCVAASTQGSSSGSLAAASGTGWSQGVVAASGTSDAWAEWVGVSGTGTTRSQLVGASATGNGYGSWVGVSATGHAAGSVLSVSGCDASGGAVCTDP